MSQEINCSTATWLYQWSAATLRLQIPDMLPGEWGRKPSPVFPVPAATPVTNLKELRLTVYPEDALTYLSKFATLLGAAMHVLTSLSSLLTKLAPVNFTPAQRRIFHQHGSEKLIVAYSAAMDALSRGPGS